jgi:hypothetical protein
MFVLGENANKRRKGWEWGNDAEELAVLYGLPSPSEIKPAVG